MLKKKKKSQKAPAQLPAKSATVLFSEYFNKPVHFEAFPIKLTEDDTQIHVPNRVQIAKTGTFRKQNKAGKWVEIEITREMLSEIVTNFENNVRGVDIALDFAHNSDDEAAGWFKSLEIKDSKTGSQLWAELDWTPDGHAAVQSKKFRYLSPEFDPNYVDNETEESFGTTLLGAGLTNRPVIKNMAPVVEFTEETEMTKKEIEALKAQAAKATTLAEENAALKIQLADAAESDEVEGDEPPAPVKKEMSLEEALAECKKLSEELADLKKKDAQTMSEVAKVKKTASFDKLLGQGKVVEAQRDAFMSDDVVKFSELSVPVKLKAVGTEGDGAAPETTAQEKVLKLAEEKVLAKKARNRADAISMVLSENKDLNEAYEEEMSEDAA